MGDENDKLLIRLRLEHLGCTLHSAEQVYFSDVVVQPPTHLGQRFLVLD